jgi:hypothetical protein
MVRSTTSARKLAVLAALAVMTICAIPGVASAQEDPLKFSSSNPVLIIFQVKADKTAEWLDAWKGILALLDKSPDADLKALGATLGKHYKVDQPPIDQGGQKANLFVFVVDSPSTKFTYNPRELIYTHLKAGQEGSPITRAEADPPYQKLAEAYLGVYVWKLTK